MNAKVAYSRISVKSQTVLPRDVRERLGSQPGDRLRHRPQDSGITVEKVEPETQDDPFAAFTEWASAEDDEAFADL